jgi:hypothetical protein
MLAGELRRAIEEAQAEETRFAAALPERERKASGTHEQWSAKDLVAHTAAAKGRLAAALEDAAVGRHPSLEHDEADVYAANAAASWSDIEARAEAAAESLLEQLSALCDRRLTDRSAFGWLDGRSIGAVAIGYAVTHPLTHLADFREQHAGREAGAATRARLIEILESLPDELHDAGTRENLAAARARPAS